VKMVRATAIAAYALTLVGLFADPARAQLYGTSLNTQGADLLVQNNPANGQLKPMVSSSHQYP
jgi:hypothetical protein